MVTKDKTLQALRPGQSGVILTVGNQSGAVKRRLVDMGLTPGAAVTVLRIAPLGDPIEIRLRGYELSLRKEDAAQIAVRDGAPARLSRPPSSVSYGARRADPETLRRIRAQSRGPGRPERPDAGEVRGGRPVRIALAGNPNSGKTTLFNALTGSNQYVGNWPGVTVEKKEGSASLEGREAVIVDLPGIYSLSPYSLEELVARDYILGTGGGEIPDAVLNIVDATNLERNLYLTVQLLELERPMLVALGFMDEARRNGDVIDTARLSEALGVPVVPISAKTGENIGVLLRAAIRQTHAGYTLLPDGLYDGPTSDAIDRVGRLIRQRAETANLPVHWAAVKLLEGDARVLETLELDDDMTICLEHIIGDLKVSCDLKVAGDFTYGVTPDIETHLADCRYRFIGETACSAVKKGGRGAAKTTTDRIDRIVTHRVFALPIFLLAMLLLFAVTFGPPGGYLTGGVAFLVGRFSGWLAAVLAEASAVPWLVSLICDGVIPGVGGVLTFLPQIALLFFFLSLLEDTGYMARAAFIMDRLLRHFGLSGKSFIPMLMGFGCSVPAVMGARTMENEKDRKMTILLIPFMSCSAKLPVYGLVATAFFGAWGGLAVFSLYALGMALAVVSGLLFRRTLFSGDPAPFVMELPPYRLPTLGNTLTHVWDRVRSFLVRAGTLIFLMSAVLWFLQHFDLRLHLASGGNSILAQFGSLVAPVFRPAGFGMWQAAVALLAGLVAKEAVVASLSMLYGFSLTATGVAVAAAMTGFTPLAAFSYLVFILLYVPCVAAVSTIYKELGSLRWTAFSVLWQLGVAYILSSLVYQIGRMLGL
jgi:ferrous iron transport protein B